MQVDKTTGKRKAPRAAATSNEARLENVISTSSHVMEISTQSKEPRVDSRLLAARLGIQHKNTFELLQKHKEAFLDLGLLPFKTEARLQGQHGGGAKKFALLNEDQAYFLLTMSRNTPRVVRLKVELVKAFSQARKRMSAHELDYLPSYHELHDAIARVAGDSPNAKWAHVNANKAINKLAGIEAGQRSRADRCTYSLLTLAVAATAAAVNGAKGIKEVQPAIKRALQPLEALSLVGAPKGSIQ